LEEGHSREGSKGAREQASEGVREQGSKGAREQASEGVREQGSKGAREKLSEERMTGFDFLSPSLSQKL